MRGTDRAHAAVVGIPHEYRMIPYRLGSVATRPTTYKRGVHGLEDVQKEDPESAAAVCTASPIMLFCLAKVARSSAPVLLP